MRYHEEGFYTSLILENFGIFHGFGVRGFEVEALSEMLKTINHGKKIFIPKTKQIHGSDVRFLCKKNTVDIYNGDSWLTDENGVVCLVRTADCLPLLLYDRKRKMAGAVHCGWRGISEHIVAKTIVKMEEGGANPDDIFAVIGPRIRKDCYNVGEELIDSFKKNNWRIERFLEKIDDKNNFSMASSVIYELKKSGVREENIESMPLCTNCLKTKFYSHRREPENILRQINFISVIPI